MPATTYDPPVDRLPDSAAPIEVVFLQDATFGAAARGARSLIATIATSCSGRAAGAAST